MNKLIIKSSIATILCGLIFHEFLPSLEFENPLIDFASVLSLVLAGYPVAGRAWRALSINREININLLMTLAAVGALARACRPMPVVPSTYDHNDHLSSTSKGHSPGTNETQCLSIASGVAPWVEPGRKFGWIPNSNKSACELNRSIAGLAWVTNQVALTP